MPGIMSDSDLLSLGGTMRRDSHGNQSLLSAMNNFVSAVDEMDDAVMIPCKLQDMTSDMNAMTSSSSPGGKTVAGNQEKSLLPAANKTGDLYTYFKMLNAIKSELVQGPPKDADQDAGNDDIAEQTATAFRHHLRGLFDVLRQMTSAAEILTTTYKGEVGDTSSTVTSSTRNLSQFSL